MRTKRAHTGVSVRADGSLPEPFCFVGLPLGIMGNEWFSSSVFCPAREAGGFGCLRGKTNTLPQISSSHSLELVLAKTPLSGDSATAEGKPHLRRERASERWDGWVGWSSLGGTGAVSVPTWKCGQRRELRGHGGGTRRPGAFLGTSILGIGHGIWESQQPWVKHHGTEKKRTWTCFANELADHGSRTSGEV